MSVKLYKSHFVDVGRDEKFKLQFTNCVDAKCVFDNQSLIFYFPLTGCTSSL